MTTRQISWLSLLDSQERAENRLAIEYEFTASGSPGLNNGRTHADGMRVFRGQVSQRGAYADDVSASDNTLTWGGVAIIWNGEELTWGDD